MGGTALDQILVTALTTGMELTVNNVQCIDISQIPIMTFLFTALCDPPCSNGGNCTGPDTCQCPDNWNGAYCEQRNKNFSI